jgi:hypothetical protein
MKYVFHLQPLLNILLLNLKVYVPLDQKSKDNKGWGKMGYSVNQGYHLELQNLGLYQKYNKSGEHLEP